MKKKRFLPMCLCLVLALGLSACNDLEDLADSGGDGETSETSPTEPGDTGDTSPTEPGGSEGPSESVPTYSIQIVDPSGDLQLEVGESATIAVSLVTTVDNTDSSVAGTASNVTLSSSNSSVVSVDGLTIYALAEGDAVITATWTEHGVTSSDLNVTVTAPVYTPTVEYSIAITSPSSGLSVLTNNPITIGVSLITTVDGTPTSEEGSAETVELNINPDTSYVTIDGLTITDTVAETVTVSATWKAQNITSEPITITFVEPSAEPVITYGVTITNPTSETVLNVGSELTVAATLYTYSDGAVSASEAATAENVTVELDASSTGSVDISGLTITGKTAGSVTLIVTWGEYATASVTFTVESVYTYAIEVSDPTSTTTLKVGDTLEVSATLITYTDGTPTGSETATASDISVTQTGGTGSVDISGLTITGKSAGEVTLTITWGEYATEEVTFEVISVITYGVKITSPTSGTEVEVGSTLTFTVDLITYTDGVETSRDTSVSSGVTLSASSTDTGEVDISGLTITGKTAGEVTITATDSYGNTDSVTIKVIEAQVFESYTITIQLKTSGGQAFPAPTGTTYSVFINSEYDVDAWSNWGTHLMTYDETSDTYSYTYTSLPTSTSTTHTANFYACSTTSSDDIPWADERALIGSYDITISDSDVGDVKSDVIPFQLSFTTWEEIFVTTSRTNFTITWYFVDNAASPTTYYSIPDYADGYITGYLNSTSSWYDYWIGGDTKMSGDATNGYSVTFSEILAGTVTYNIYFEYNSNAGDSAASNATWNYHIWDNTNNTTMVVPDTGDSLKVYVECDPSTIISSPTVVDPNTPAGDTTNFYIVVVDNSSLSSLSLDWVGIQSGGSFVGTSYANSCDCTISKTHSNAVCVVTDHYAALTPSTGSDWYTVHTDNTYNDQIEFNSVSDVPETSTGTYALLIGYADMSKLGDVSSSDNKKTITSYSWATGFASLDAINAYITGTL